MPEAPNIGSRMFLRGTSAAMDAQGRVVFPKVWRLPGDSDKTVFMLCPGLSRSISVLPKERFDDILAKALTAPSTAEAQNYLSVFATYCQQITLDKQGRFQLGDQLMSYAGITDKVECVGALTYGRLFAPENWQKIRLNTPEPPVPDTPPANATEEELEHICIRKAIEYIGTL